MNVCRHACFFMTFDIATWGHMGVILGTFWGHLEARMPNKNGCIMIQPSWGDLGAFLETSWSYLGAILGVSWGYLEEIWGLSGAQDA